MPILKSSQKALRVAKRRKAENEVIIRKIRQALKTLRASPNPTTLRQVYSILDRGAKKHIFHRNKAARLKSQYSKLVKTEKISKTKKASKKTQPTN